jgi:hypothetical protein
VTGGIDTARMGICGSLLGVNLRDRLQREEIRSTVETKNIFDDMKNCAIYIYIADRMQKESNEA